MSKSLIYDPTDLVFRFGNGLTRLNVVRSDGSGFDALEKLALANGGLAKLEYVAVNGQMVDVGKVVRENPNILSGDATNE